MRILGLLTATVLVVCFFTYFTRQPSLGPAAPDEFGEGSDSQTYASAINAAKGTVQNSEAARRRNFLLELRLAGKESAGGIEQIENPVYTAEGANSEILVVTSNSIDKSRCSRFAASEYGAAAGGAGFVELVCRNRISRADHRVQLEQDR